MPKYSVSGLIGAGIAGGVVSRAGVVVAQPAGGACWLDATRLIYARKVGEPNAWALKAHNGAVEIAIDEAGATELRAGGGVWAAERGGPGVRSNRHPTMPLAGLRDVGPDGTLAYCRDRQDGRGLILRALDGTTTILVPESAACSDVQVHSTTEATWVQGGVIRSTYGQPVTPEGRCGSPRVVQLANKRVLLYWHEDSQGERLLLQTDWSKPVGYVLTKPGQRRNNTPDWPAHRPDLIALDTLKACWSITEAEGPASIRELMIDLTRPVVDLKRPPAIPQIGRRLWCGFFLFSPFDLTVPGNCDLRVELEMLVRDEQGRKVASYVAGDPDGDVASLERNVLAAKAKHGLPVVAYWTRAAQAGRVPRGAEIIGVESYRLKTESLLEFETRVRASIRRCGKAAIIAQCYTSNALHHTDLAALVPVYATIAKDSPNVVAILAFSGSGRPTGLNDHPDVRPLWSELARGIIGPPPLPEPPDPPVDPEEPPVAFPTDAEFADFFNRLNAKYAGPEMNRPAINPPCHVDPIGMGRWTSDYFVHSQAGHSHEVRWQKVNAEINRILGIPNP